MLELTRIDCNCGYEKTLMKKAKNEFKSILLKINDKNSCFLLNEEECQELMEQIYTKVKNIIEFIELELLN